jgi:hypothetical protein
MASQLSASLASRNTTSASLLRLVSSACVVCERLKRSSESSKTNRSCFFFFFFFFFFSRCSLAALKRLTPTHMLHGESTLSRRIAATHPMILKLRFQSTQRCATLSMRLVVRFSFPCAVGTAGNLNVLGLESVVKSFHRFLCLRYAPQGSSLGNMWRIAGDVNTWQDALSAMDANSKLARFAGPGGFNDPDMLLGSSPGSTTRLTPVQSRTQFSVWAIMAAPLLLSGNVANMTKGKGFCVE